MGLRLFVLPDGTLDAADRTFVLMPPFWRTPSAVVAIVDQQLCMQFACIAAINGSIRSHAATAATAYIEPAMSALVEVAKC